MYSLYNQTGRVDSLADTVIKWECSTMRLCKGYPGTREHGGKMGGNTGTFRKKVREHGNIALPISGTGNIIFEGEKRRKAQSFRK